MGLPIQFLSDLHCDFGGNWCNMLNCPVMAETLVIAGDVLPWTYPKWNRFCDNILSRWPRVIHVMGNHDYWGMDVNNSDHRQKLSFMKIRDEWKTKKNSSGSTEYYQIHNDFVDIHGIRILCSTLWSPVVREVFSIIRGMNDYQQIKGFTVDLNNTLNSQSVSYLELMLQDTKHKCVVVTHNLPLWCFVQLKFWNSTLNEAYANDLRNLVERFSDKIKLWNFGHTHDFIRKEIMGIDFLCNPVGYYEVGQDTGFDNKLVVEV